MRGFYLGKDDQGRKYAATQFEATDARRAFPSFDEPDTKPRSTSPLTPTRDMVAISNQKISLRYARPRRQTHRPLCHHSPKMSSYLARWSWATLSTSKARPTAFRFASTRLRGKKKWASSLWTRPSTSSGITTSISDIKYPYGKLDLIGLPDFSAGAMENTGCITFREVILLIDEKQGSVGLKKESLR
jgi:aminopeptidase N